MKVLVRFAAAVSVVAIVMGASSVFAGKSHPAPPQDVLCGCLCPDGSIVITHAPDENSCPAVCATACDNTM